MTTTTTIPIAALARMTAEEFEQHCLDVPLCELVRGEAIQLSPGGMDHGGSTSNACALLATWAKRTALGRTFTGEIGLVTQRNPDSVRGADVAYFSYARVPKGQRPSGFSRIPPELVVEVIGKGQGWKTLVAKAAEYLQMGVDRVWVLDPGKQTLTIFRKNASPTELQRNDELRDEEILPGFICHVLDFFED